MKTMKPVKLNPQFVVLITVMIFLVVSSQFTTNAQKSEDLIPTAPNGPTIFDRFPDNLHCSDIEEIAEGPEWNTIKVGKSTLDDLLLVVEQIGDYDVVENDDDLESWTFLHRLQDYSVPLWINVCIRNNIITALNFYLPPVYDIYTLFSLYGVPDTIVDTNSEYLTKLFFWFEAGVIAEVFSVEGDSFGVGGNIILIPYQSPEDYEQRYPFTIILELVKQDVVNPFDFDAVIATAVAMPSPTATPTLMPHQTSTPAPQPTRHSP